MINRIFLAALLAGLLAGVCVSLVQAVVTTPMIVQAETYEAAAPTLDGAAICSSDEADCDTGDAWAPADGLERFAYTALANVGTGVAFALILVAGMVIRGEDVSGRIGLLWGVAGFAAFTLSPALGMPPEVPAIPTGDLMGRQIWWACAVASAVAGLSALTFGQAPWVRIVGVFILVLPHAVGAPHGPSLASSVPPDLSARFAAAAISVNAIFWVLIGWFAGTFFAKWNGDGDA